MPTLPGLRRRNPVALSPLLPKGGVHQRSKSGLCNEAKLQLQEELEFWLEKLDGELNSKVGYPRAGSVDNPNITGI